MRSSAAAVLTVVEDPSASAFSDMPRSVASICKPHFMVRAAELPCRDGTGKARTSACVQLPRMWGRAQTSTVAISGTVSVRWSFFESQSDGVEKGVNVVLNEQAEFARQMIQGARDAPLGNGLVYWERLQAQAEEQMETLRRFLEQRPVVRGDTGAADT
jgi:hypothetical protein